MASPTSRTMGATAPGPIANDQGRHDTERSQGIVRVIIVFLFTIYSGIAITQPAVMERDHDYVVLCGMVWVASILLLAWIIRRPGVNLPRRALAMAHDYGATATAMIIGGQDLLPLYSVLLWVTVGNGFRYGPRYLVASTILALSALAVVFSATSYWHAQPYVAATLVITTVIVPAYAHGLLTRLHRAYDAALEANLAKSRFLAQASHDLRQPIHAISLFTACLRDTGLEAEQQQMVANIDKSLNSVAGLFRSLLDVSTLDSGRVTPKIETVALRDVLGEVVRQNSEAAQWAGVTLRMVTTRHHVRIDAGLLTTILQNIVSNALKYAPGRPVLIGCRRRGQALRIEVYDRGHGIAAQHLPRLFEEFYQVRAPGDKDVEGVGLGLSIVQRLCRLMGLSVAIRSTVGRGTLVAIEGLAIATGPERPVRVERPGAPAMLEGLRVLLVEDDEAALVATATLLAKWGCTVQPETGVPAGVVDCDLIITDFDLGARTTGTECIARIREVTGRRIPAVVMTGHDEHRVRNDLADPEIPILSKPVRPAELRSILVAEKLKAARAA